MTKLSNNLMNLLQKEDNKFFDILTDIKNKLLNLYNSDIVRTKDKDLILKKYSSFDELGKSAYKYFKLKDNDLYDEAQKEFDNVSNLVLKGSVSNTVFIWHSEFGEHTCEDCASLDGTQYTLEEDIPDTPHPNCKCYIEIVEFDGEEDGEGDGNGETRDNKNPENKNTNHNAEPRHHDSKSDSQLTPRQQKLIMPCNGTIVGHYGEQRSTHVHNGIDIAVPVGTPVKAVADGIVYYAGANDPKGYGQYVIITHKINGKTITSEYGHLSSWNVRAGQQIKQGQVIAKSGNTGHSQGPHLHLTIREGLYKGTPVNPNIYVNY